VTGASITGLSVYRAGVAGSVNGASVVGVSCRCQCTLFLRY
jgi:hypothetical protein